MNELSCRPKIEHTKSAYDLHKCTGKVLSFLKNVGLMQCRQDAYRSRYEGNSVSLGDYTHKKNSKNGSPSSPMVLYKVNPSFVAFWVTTAMAADQIGPQQTGVVMSESPVASPLPTGLTASQVANCMCSHRLSCLSVLQATQRNRSGNKARYSQICCYGTH